MIIESKVLIPAVAGFVAAALALATAFGLDLTDDQRNAVLGVATAAVVLLQAVLGYLAPHTPRPDLPAAHGAPAPRGDHGESAVVLVLAIVGIIAVVLFVLNRA